MTSIAEPVPVVSRCRVMMNKQENEDGQQADGVALYSYTRKASHIGAGCRLSKS